MTTDSPIAARPDHVPAAAVYDFDMYRDPGLLRDPHERVRELLRDAPGVFWTPRNGGHWVALNHEAAFEASRNAELFSNASMPPEYIARLMALLPPDAPHFPQPVPINLDPPDHTKYRLPLNPAFSPKVMQARRAEIRALADRLIDRVAGQGHCDFIADIAEPLPVEVFLRIMGLPVDRLREFRDLVHVVLAPPSADLVENAGRLRKVADAMKDVMEARRSEPRDDLISLLWKTEIEGRPMDWNTIENFAVLLFIAGLDTVINGMGFGIRHLALDPQLQARLRADPSLIPEAQEEILRRYTFVVPPRRVARDTVLGGWPMKRNDKLQVYLPAADLDPAKFAHPEQVDLDRESKAHIGFGAGPHRCLGSHLARVELGVLYEQMLARLPTFRLDPDQPVVFRAGNILAIESMPLRWD
jgi:cytochrome P450